MCSRLRIRNIPTGLVPCLECPRDSFTGTPPPGGFTDCLACPADAPFTHQPAAPSVATCRPKCAPGTYSVTGLAPCAACLNHFFQHSEGKMSCMECPSSAMTIGTGAKSRMNASLWLAKKDSVETGDWV